MPHPLREDRRRKVRMKLPQTVRVRPSQPLEIEFDEVVPTLNASRESIYFATHHRNYFKGMRLLVSYPYSPKPGAINREFIGEVKRIDQLEPRLFGIAVHLVMPFYFETIGARRKGPFR